MNLPDYYLRWTDGRSQSLEFRSPRDEGQLEKNVLQSLRQFIKELGNKRYSELKLGIFVGLTLKGKKVYQDPTMPSILKLGDKEDPGLGPIVLNKPLNVVYKNGIQADYQVNGTTLHVDTEEMATDIVKAGLDAALEMRANVIDFFSDVTAKSTTKEKD